MYEIYVLVEKKPDKVKKIIGTIMGFVGVLGLGLFLIADIIFALVAILGFGAFFLLAKQDVEYEYSYFDGDVRFAKVLNKSKRRELPSYDMEDVLVLAPITDRSLHHHLQNSSIKQLDYTTGYENAKVYGLVAKTEKGMELVKFEPDQRYLEAVCVKYRQKVVQ